MQDFSKVPFIPLLVQLKYLSSILYFIIFNNEISIVQLDILLDIDLLVNEIYSATSKTNQNEKNH